MKGLFVSHGLYPQHEQYEQPEDGTIGPPQSGHTVRAIPTSLENDASSTLPKRYFFARNETVAFLLNAPVASQDAPERVFITK